VIQFVASIIIAAIYKNTPLERYIGNPIDGYVRVIWTIPVYLALSAISHYVQQLANGAVLKLNVNYVRWIEYACTFPVMYLAVALLSTVDNFYEILFIMLLSSLTGFFGYMIDTMWNKFLFGLQLIVQAVPSLLIMIRFFEEAGDVPKFVIAVFILSIVYSYTIPFLLGIHHLKNINSDKIDMCHTLITVSYQTSLTWFILIGGVMM
jgi:hypothetical protein